jgi:LacI family repressor for deo operon, udp, cdd, tsx, nupC, and nupG
MAYFDHVTSHRADGIILLTGQLPPAFVRSGSPLPPLVLAAEPLMRSRLPTVGVDHAGGAEEAVRHLIHLGHRRIAHIAGLDSVLSAGSRMEGYRKALRAARISVDESLIQRGSFTVDSGTSAMHALLRQRRMPTAVFCANDQMAMGAIRALRSLGLRVPADVSVIGFDDGELAEIYDPPLTTVHIPRFDVGYQAMMTLADVISHARPVRSVTLPTRLVVRATSAAPRNP